MQNHNHRNHDGSKNMYLNLLLMFVLSFIAMYILMYAMVDSLPNIFSNYNQFYMAGLMSSPMIVIELLLMGMMYRNKKLNLILIATSIILGLVFFLMIRNQSFVSDEQFLKSMIPHHASAILMCENAPLKDERIIEICKNIIVNQKNEIEEMKMLLRGLSN